MLLLLALACGSPAPRVDGFQPAQGEPGTVIRVAGSDLPADARLELGGRPLEDQRVLGVAAMEGKVPGGLAAGPQPLVLKAGSTTLEVGRFEVLAGPRFLGEPCGGDFTAFSALASDQGKVVIDKHFKAPPGQEEGRRETVRIPFEDVEAVLYEERPLPGGRTCSAIWIAVKDGRRELFDDDEEVLLKDRAQQIAVALGRPIQVLSRSP